MSATKIVIVDLGLGNAGSVANMLRIQGVEAIRSAAPEVVQAATKLILPGIGSFDAGIERFERSGLVPLLNERVLQARVPVLGICLGMQLMTRSSDEGQKAGLGWVPAHTRRFNFGAGSPVLRVPHMGWNQVEFRPESQLGANMPGDARFYFVHSYHVVPVDEAAIWMGRTTYGYQFTSGFSAGNIHGVQFHPEKSHKFGLQLLANFAALPTA